MRQPMPILRRYTNDLAKEYNGAWVLMDKSKCEVIDVSDCFVEDSLPSNSQMFGMTNIANALTTRTV